MDQFKGQVLEESTRVWINKIESKLDAVSTEFTRGFAQLSTKLDIYLGRQDDHERRLSQLEEYRHKQDGVNEASNKRYTRITLLLIGTEILFLGVGLLISVVVKGH